MARWLVASTHREVFSQIIHEIISSRLFSATKLRQPSGKVQGSFFVIFEYFSRNYGFIYELRWVKIAIFSKRGPYRLPYKVYRLILRKLMYIGQ